MAERRQRFRESDLIRAIEAARKAGEKGVVRVEIEGGKITVVTYPPGQNDPVREGNEWDGVGASA
jgi:hypothetical protein